MHIFNVTLQSVVALLAIGVLGFWIIKRNIIPESILRFLAILAIEIALPCIVFVNLITQFSPSSFVRWWQYPLWWLAFSAIAFLLTLITMSISAKASRREFAFTLFFQNGLFFPFIIITGIFGPTNPYIAVLFIFIAFHPSLFFSTDHLFFKRTNRKIEEEPKGKRRLRLERILNPVLISTVLAAGIKLVGVDKHLPTFILTVFQMLGGMSLPLLMLILGGSLYVDFQSRGPIYIREVMKFVLMKNIIFPLAFIAMLALIRPAYPVALIVFLESAVPPITGVPIQTQRHGGNSSITNQFILASFVFSIFSIPLMFTLFSRYFPIP
ncbi:MAG TPA: AEC family transporter [Thermodesulfobacteriota bacterium]|nr:AEC family transporter [Thermodesulfobacteriota bacterium]